MGRTVLDLGDEVAVVRERRRAFWSVVTGLTLAALLGGWTMLRSGVAAELRMHRMVEEHAKVLPALDARVRTLEERTATKAQIERLTVLLEEEIAAHPRKRRTR